MKRQQEWQLNKVEVKAERQYARVKLKGRIDRIDQRDGLSAVIDYKTGRPPGSEDVLAGEAVQLPSYALMLPGTVGRLDYLEIGNELVLPRETGIDLTDVYIGFVIIGHQKIETEHTAVSLCAQPPAYLTGIIIDLVKGGLLKLAGNGEIGAAVIS